MRIVVTSQGEGLDSPADPRFGRARYLVLVDTETGECSSVDNEINLNAPQGAGIQTGKRVVELKAQAVITGHTGPKAFSVLDAGGVAIYTGASGTVRQALEQFKGGTLQKAQSADVEGHWV
ncbi:MAG: dinitrogenase iron-molybdenum cofactor biosynthesis protein [Phycisphaerae bacterium]|nr:dinitrogenase iron-molybdenum cofactor biosynthesis protein [Phycisphaerae bacterium]